MLDFKNKALLSRFKYPIRVLKNKIADPKFEPFLFDSTEGELIIVPPPRKSTLIQTIISAVIGLAVIGYISYTFAEPLVETSYARFNVSQELKHISKDEAVIVSQIIALGKVEYENTTNNLVTLNLNISQNKIRQAINLAFQLPTVKEVTTSGESLRITFISKAYD